MRNFLLFLAMAVAAVSARAQVYSIPSGRLPFAGAWTPHAADGTGVPGGIPTNRTNLIDVTLSPYFADKTGATNASTAIQAAVDAAADGDVVYLPNGTYRLNQTIFLGVYPTHQTHHITVRGQSRDGVIIDARVNIAFQMGYADGFATPFGASGSDMAVTAAPVKGSASLQVGSTTYLSTGQLIIMSIPDDDTIPTIAVNGYPSTMNQVFRVTGIVDSTHISVSPKVLGSSGTGSGLGIALAHAELIGIETLTVDSANGGTDGIKMDASWSCWVKGVHIRSVPNYPVQMINTLQCEVRDSYIEPNHSFLHTNGAGILHNYGSSDLIENNIVLGCFPDVEINFGTAGCVFSRNYFVGTNFNTNHAPTNRYNLYECNVTGGVLDDGYFGGSVWQTYFNNMFGFMSLKRFTRYTNMIGNMSLQNDTDFQLGYPNIANSLNNGLTVNPPTTFWRDWHMVGTVVSRTMGTGTGYVTAGAVNVGDTSMTVTGGTGTILVNDAFQFPGQSRRYLITSVVGNVIGFQYQNGLEPIQSGDAVGPGTAITLSSDTGVISYSSGKLNSFDGFNYQYPVIHWGGFAFNQKYTILTATSSTANVIRIDLDRANLVPLPAAGTVLDRIGPGIYINPPEGTFQEIDLGVAGTLERVGNRFANGVFDSLGSATSLPESLIYTTKPQWMIDEETELSALAGHAVTFDLRAFDPITPVSPSGSNIPAGFRSEFTTPPQVLAASINSLGTELSVTENKPLQAGAGGNTGVTLSGGTVTLSFARFSGSSIVFTLSRVVSEDESFTCTYVQPGNGFEDSNLIDLPSFSTLFVVNGSQQTAGASWLHRALIEATDSAIPANQSAAYVQGVDVPLAGNATKIRIGIGPTNLFNDAAKVALLDSGGNVLETATGTITKTSDYQVFGIASHHLTAGTYYIALLVNANSDPDIAFKNGTGPNSSFYSFANSGYAAWPGSPVTFDGGNGGQFAFGLRLTPDAPTETPRHPVGRYSRGTSFHR